MRITNIYFVFEQVIPYEKKGNGWKFFCNKFI